MSMSGLLGGVLIGLAATVYLLATGRVAGVSGILAGALGERAARGERIAFLAGLVGAGLIAAVVAVAGRRHALPDAGADRRGRAGRVRHARSAAAARPATACAASRALSRASLVATATFIATGAATVAVANHFFFAAGTP